MGDTEFLKFYGVTFFDGKGESGLGVRISKRLEIDEIDEVENIVERAVAIGKMMRVKKTKKWAVFFERE